MACIGSACSEGAPPSPPGEERDQEPLTPCEDYCYTASRTPDCGIEDDDCEATCEAFERAREPACSTQQDSLLACFVYGDFTCEGGEPVPAPGRCGEELLDLLECGAREDCSAMCSLASQAGCAHEECLSRCTRLLDVGYPRCEVATAAVMACHVEQGECRNGAYRPPAGCREEVDALADCEHIDEPCRAYCRVADVEGCMPAFADCEAECEANEAHRCSYEIDYVLLCRYDHGFTCVDGVAASPPDCAEDEANLAACLQEEG